MTRLRFRTYLLIIVWLACWTSSAQGVQRDTWKLLKNFGSTIDCGYFFDKDHGLLGAGVRPATWYDIQNNPHLVQGTPVAIYKTTNGGATWIACLVPTTELGAVTAISMLDTLVGYASIFSDVEYDTYHSFGKSSIWKTTDGGLTWQDSLHLDHDATCIYAQNGLILFTKWDWYYTSVHTPPIDTFGGAYSFDGGKTWTENFRRGNGIAFTDSLHGVISEMNDAVLSYWNTSDAGRTWKQTATQFESWSIYGVAGTSMFFCANESQLSLPHQSVNWSTDGGATWSERMHFPNMHFTGTIQGKGSTLYIQTDSMVYLEANPIIQGMYRSDDLGATWHWVGGPSNSRDTRFVVTGCSGEVVYAFDGYGNVWKTEDGGDGTIPGGNPYDASFFLSSDSTTWSPSPCGDSLNFSVTSSACVPVTIDSIVQLVGTDLIPISGRTLPLQLRQGDSISAALVFSPIQNGSSQSTIRVYGHSGYLLIKRDLRVTVANPELTGMILSKTTSTMNVSGCESQIDTINLVNFGCPGLILDSVNLPRGEIVVLNAFPDSISNDHLFPLRLAYSPDSAGTHIVTAEVFAHNGRRRYDTLLTITAASARVPLRFLLDSSSIQFETKYCKLRESHLHIATTSCDSLWIDSVRISNPSFILAETPSGLRPRTQDSIRILFVPDSFGVASGTLHLFAHTHIRNIDTVVSLGGNNFGLPQALTMSTTALLLSTKGCRPTRDSITISNQCCESLYLDSLAYPRGELTLIYDTLHSTLASDDSLRIAIVFAPNDGVAKLVSVHAYLHTSKRVIDTVFLIRTANAIPSNPLQVTSDSLFLWTKYCQPTTIPLMIANYGCPDMRIDSAVITDDARHEFAIDPIKPVVLSQDSIRVNLQFWPDTSGTRSAHLKLYTSGGKEVDTTLAVSGKNLVAPEPYVPTLPKRSAGQILRIPIMLRTTLDTFTIQSFVAHLRFNTDLLTAYGLDFNGTCAKNVKSSSLNFEPGNGASVRIVLQDTISDTSELTLPLVYVLDSVRVALDTTTMVVLDTFVTDREPALALCSIPEQPFTLEQLCPDPFYLDLLRGNAILFDLISISPNPATQQAVWDVQYDLRKYGVQLTLDLFDSRGIQVSSQMLETERVGKHHVSVTAPRESGDYTLVMSDGTRQVMRKVTLKR